MIHSSSPYALTHSLDLLSDTYHYNHWIFSLLRPFLGDSICEIGAGTGNLSRFMLNSTKLVCIEPEPEYASDLRALSSVHLNMSLFAGSLEDYASHEPRTELVDSIVCVNVLEHIKEDAAALRMMGTLVKPNGVILIFVPACPWAFGALDLALGHYRRYTRKSLVAVVRESQLQVVRSQYVNFIGAFAWWWYSRVRGNVKIDAKGARLFDRFVPYVSAVERLVPTSVGQSLFVALKKA